MSSPVRVQRASQKPTPACYKNPHEKLARPSGLEPKIKKFDGSALEQLFLSCGRPKKSINRISMALLAGVEPTTLSLGETCSIQLSYKRHLRHNTFGHTARQSPTKTNIVLQGSLNSGSLRKPKGRVRGKMIREGKEKGFIGDKRNRTGKIRGKYSRIKYLHVSIINFVDYYSIETHSITLELGHMKYLVLVLLSLPLMGDDAAKRRFEATKYLAESGTAFSQNHLGLMYNQGIGVSPDLKEAVKWYHKAAEQGDASAQYNLGCMYDYGSGVVEDNKEAVKWYRKAAEQGFALAQYNLGNMYDSGEVLDFERKGSLTQLTESTARLLRKDELTAYAWWNIAAGNGNASAKKNKPILAKKLTPGQIAEAQELSNEMVKKNPKLINKKARVMGMIAWEGREAVLLEIREPERYVHQTVSYTNNYSWIRGPGRYDHHMNLAEGDGVNSVEALSIDADKGEVKLNANGETVSEVVPNWPVAQNANPPNKGFVTLSFDKAPIVVVLDIFSQLSGRTIIANHQHVRQGVLDFKPKGPMSRADCLEALQALLAAKAIGIEPSGNKFVRVRPIAQPDAKHVPQNGDAFLFVNAPPVEKIVLSAGFTMQGIPLDTFLDEFTALTERTIIAPANLPPITINFELNSDLSFNEAEEFYRLLLAVNGIGIKPQGNQYAIEWEPKAGATMIPNKSRRQGNSPRR